jgi:hypothetical protein
LARGLPARLRTKYDEYIDTGLLSEDYAARELRVHAAVQAASRVLALNGYRNRPV